MASELKVPTLGMDMEEATIIRWMVEEGAAVEKGDPVLEIETDKTSFEVEANEDGEIRNLRGDEGETLPVGTIVAYITAPGEKAPEHEETQEEHPVSGEDNGKAARADEKKEREPAQAAPPEPNDDRRKVRASPAARRAALEKGVELEAVTGSGPGGRVYLSDVLVADSDQEATADESPAAEVSAGEPERRETLSRVRRIGAERTTKSFSEVPHFYLTREMEADRLLELQERLKEKMDPAPGITELLALAVSRTLKDHPRLNARYAGEELELHEKVNLGLAVATDDGLVVPVLKGADVLPLRGLAPAVKDLVERARRGKLDREELSGGTFTVSNLGMMGIDSFDAVINTPEAAILAVGRTRIVPQWHDGEWLPRRIITMTLSVDHRVADGADGSRFLADLQNALTDWELLL